MYFKSSLCILGMRPGGNNKQAANRSVPMRMRNLTVTCAIKRIKKNKKAGSNLLGGRKIHTFLARILTTL